MKRASSDPAPQGKERPPELVIVTGLSGSGKGTVLKCLEDLGYYSVDNLPVDLIEKFAELTKSSPSIRWAALGADIREGGNIRRLPEIIARLRKEVPTTLLFLEAEDTAILRRFSETRRPHPMGRDESVSEKLAKEREAMSGIREMADLILDTSPFTVHELREVVAEKFRGTREETKLLIRVNSFGFRHGVPTDSDLVFDVRFLPNPNYIPEFKQRTGKHPGVARYIRSFPQTQEFIERVMQMLVFLLPHYIREGKSYLTISFGCTGGQHRSVMMAAEVSKRLAKAGYKVKEQHRDAPRG
ncbi:MAG: RNase adapter RapZ [Bryobacterales bacterium]|nr:RNase adapter RapZ [Bryobacterales bacterium]